MIGLRVEREVGMGESIERWREVFEDGIE